MVLDFTHELSVKLFRYSAHFLHFTLLVPFANLILFATLFNHFVSDNLFLYIFYLCHSCLSMFLCLLLLLKNFFLFVSLSVLLFERVVGVSQICA